MRPLTSVTASAEFVLVERQRRRRHQRERDRYGHGAGAHEHTPARTSGSGNLPHQPCPKTVPPPWAERAAPRRTMMEGAAQK